MQLSEINNIMYAVKTLYTFIRHEGRTAQEKQEAQLLLGWPTVLPYSRRLCKSCGAFMQIGPAVFS